MQDWDDLQLLREYADRQSEMAFEEIVARYINLVYSSAYRQVSDPHLAQELTHITFIILARKAGTLRPGIILPGWLLNTARFAALAELRANARRQRYENEAQMESMIQQESSPDRDWDQVAPLLDEALGQLGEQDRNALVLRFFENRPMEEVGAFLGVGAGTAQKRVSRAVEKLRRLFSKRGATLSAVAITGLLSANAVQAAPAWVASSTTTAVLSGTGLAASTAPLVQVALKLMSWAKAKTVALTTALVMLTLVGGIGSVVAIHAARVAARVEIQGSWQGVLKTSGVGISATDRTHTRVVCTISKQKGIYRASLDLIDVAQKDIPISRFVYDYPSIRLEPSHALQTFQGTVNKEGTEISGVYGQGPNSTPLVLKRTTHPDTIPEPLTESDYAARADSDLQGQWQGILGGTFHDLKLSFKIAEPTNGIFRAELDNPEQGFNRQPVSVNYKQPEVKLILFSGDGMFAGNVSQDHAELTGNWIQGGALTPVTFKRVAAIDSAAEPEKNYTYTRETDLQGHWNGSINVNGAKLGATFHIAELPDGTFSAALTSVDMGATDEVPASTVRWTAPKVFLEWKSLGLSFNGGVKNGKLAGVLSQAGMGIPVVLARSKTN